MENNRRIAHGNHNGFNGYVYRFFSSESDSYLSHIHACYEFIYVTGGSCIYTIERNKYFVMSGDMIFTRPGEMHSFSFPEKCTFTRHFLHIYPEFIKSFPELKEAFYSKENIGKHFVSSFIVEKYELGRVFETLRQYCDTTKPETAVIAYAESIGLMAKLMKIMRSEEISERYTIANPSVSKIAQYIDAHFGDELSLDSMAELIRLSKYHTSRLFKKHVGMSLTAYINMRRITEAKNMILSGKKSHDIFQMCGFNDYSTFYRSFVKFAGMSPDEFKRKMMMQPAEKIN